MREHFCKSRIGLWALNDQDAALAAIDHHQIVCRHRDLPRACESAGVGRGVEIPYPPHPSKRGSRALSEASNASLLRGPSAGCARATQRPLATMIGA